MKNKILFFGIIIFLVSACENWIIFEENEKPKNAKNVITQKEAQDFIKTHQTDFFKVVNGTIDYGEIVHKQTKEKIKMTAFKIELEGEAKGHDAMILMYKFKDKFDKIKTGALISSGCKLEPKTYKFFANRLKSRGFSGTKHLWTLDGKVIESKFILGGYEIYDRLHLRIALAYLKKRDSIHNPERLKDWENFQLKFKVKKIRRPKKPKTKTNLKDITKSYYGHGGGGPGDPPVVQLEEVVLIAPKQRFIKLEFQKDEADANEAVNHFVNNNINFNSREFGNLNFSYTPPRPQVKSIMERFPEITARGLTAMTTNTNYYSGYVDYGNFNYRGTRGTSGLNMHNQDFNHGQYYKGEFSYNYGNAYYNNYTNWSGGRGGTTTNHNKPVKIINNLEGKAKCVYDKLSKGGNINWILKNFKGDGSEFSIELYSRNEVFRNYKSINGVTILKGSLLKIEISTSKSSGRPALAVARTILHELIHADMYRKLNTKYPTNGDLDFRKTFQKYKQQKIEPTPQHETMAELYINSMKDALRDFHKNVLVGDYNYLTNNGANPIPDSFYEALAWQGLENHNVKAYTNLPASKKTELKNSLAQYYHSTTKNCP